MAIKSKPASRDQNQPTSSLFGVAVKSVAGLSLAAAGSWMLYSNLAIDHHVFLPDALPVDRQSFQSQTAGTLNFYAAPGVGAQGRPVVLLHSINAAASAYEMRPLFLNYLNQRPVYALDLPGFGFSNRANRVYTPALYEAAILDFLETQVAGGPADVVALSLSCEFAARAALLKPELFHSLILISPTGLNLKTEQGSQKASQNGMADLIHPAFSFPLWARPFYDLIATRKSIEYFLKKSFVGAVPNDLIDYAYATAHQPGAENAPLYFVSGKLFTPTICERVYAKLTTPSLILYDRDAFTRFERLPELLSLSKSIQAIRLVPTLGLPHFERLEDTAEVFERFWKQI